MNSHPVYLLEPVVHFLDKLIHNHRDLIYMPFVYIAIPLIARILERRSGRKKVKGNDTFVLVILPPAGRPPIPPVIRWNFDTPDDDSGPFGGL